MNLFDSPSADRARRFSTLLTELNRGMYDKQTEVGLALLAAIAGESILLLGPPGVAKSMVGRRLKMAFADAAAFEYLMSRFSTPDEIFGPVSIARLKEDDCYERRTSGYLPEADVVFLDEIWKAGPAIQNTLLTAINEKIFRNGDRELRLPLKLLIAASNELPAQGEGLEALWDRFLVRVVSGCIRTEEDFYRMLLDTTGQPSPSDTSSNPLSVTAPITNDEYARWQKEIDHISVPRPVLLAITAIRQSLRGILIEGTDIRRTIYVSDRRWKHILRLMRASAFIHGRDEVTPADLLPIYHCLWNEPVERGDMQRLVLEGIFSRWEQSLAGLSAQLKADVRVTQVKEALLRAHQAKDYRDDRLRIDSGLYYRVEGHGTGHTFVFVVDFKQLPEYDPQQKPAAGILYSDPEDAARTILRLLDSPAQLSVKGARRVTLARDDRYIYISGARYPLQQLAPGETQTLATGCDDKSCRFSHRDYEQDIDEIYRGVTALQWELKAGLFVTPEDLTLIDRQVTALQHEVAMARVDIRKLYYGE